MNRPTVVHFEVTGDTKHEPWISSGTGRVKVRVIRTDEELMIAKSVMQVLHLGSNQES